MDDHKLCPWCKEETDRIPECFDEDDSVWTIVCGTCRGSGPLVFMEGEKSEVCIAEAWKRWDEVGEELSCDEEEFGWWKVPPWKYKFTVTGRGQITVTGETMGEGDQIGFTMVIPQEIYQVIQDMRRYGYSRAQRDIRRILGIEGLKVGPRG
jgi:hypothetical protein